MIGRSIGFTRWYDRVPSLSQAVRMMEKTSEHAQHVIATTIIGSLQLHQIAQRGDHGLKKLGTEKIMGLMKSKGKRRWYDRDPVVHQAFNYLYLMDDQTRHEIAIKIMISIRALEESSQKGHPPRLHNSLVKGIFNKQLQLLLDQTEFIVRSSGEHTRIHVSVEAPAPAKKEPEPTEKPAAANNSQIDASNEGMRIIRLKKQG